MGELKHPLDPEHNILLKIFYKKSKESAFLLGSGKGKDSEALTSVSPHGGYPAVWVTEDSYRLLGGAADLEEGERRRWCILEDVGLGVQIAGIAAAVGATLGG